VQELADFTDDVREAIAGLPDIQAEVGQRR
jgi:hypothetical protein